MKVYLVNKIGAVVHTNLSPEEIVVAKSCLVENETFVKKSKKFRHGKLVGEHGFTYILTDDQAIVDRPRYFKEILRAHSALLHTVPAIRSQMSNGAAIDARRLLHNLPELNGKNIQEMFLLVPEDELRKTSRQKELIRKKIQENPNQVSEAFLRIIKNNAAIRNEFSVFKKLQETRPKIVKQKHNARRALSNILYIFYQDFNDCDVRVLMGESETTLLFDYETIQVAMYHLFDNATKYILPHSDLKIDFLTNEESFIIRIDMISMRILPEEFEKIYSEGFSGHYPRQTGKNGKGIGMSMINRLLPLNGAKLVVIPSVDKTKSVNLDGVEYENNIFEISFQKRWITHD